MSAHQVFLLRLILKAQEKADINVQWRGRRTYGVYYFPPPPHQNTACVATLTNSQIPEKSTKIHFSLPAVMRSSSYKEREKPHGYWEPLPRTHTAKCTAATVLGVSAICVWELQDSICWLASGNLGLVLGLIQVETNLLIWSRSLLQQ